MKSSIDLAAYITSKYDELGVMKLQRLVYYCQAWSLVWLENKLFDDEIEAWCNGPVIIDLLRMCDDRFIVNSKLFNDGNHDRFSSDEKELINIVIETYGSKSTQWLCDMIRSEDPWKRAYASVSRIFDLGCMSSYYRNESHKLIDHAKMDEFSRDISDADSIRELHRDVITQIMNVRPLNIHSSNKFIYLNISSEIIREEVGVRELKLSGAVPFMLVSDVKEGQSYWSAYDELRASAREIFKSMKAK